MSQPFPSLAGMIADRETHLLDGAIGTLLYARGVFVNVCYDELNLSRPEMVQRIHAEYVAAGSEIVETNSFGANPVKLSSFGLEAETEEINRAGAHIAREAVRGRARVVGAIGPLGVRIEPFGPTGRDEAEELFGRQVDGLLDGGVDGFMLETFSDLDELHAALRACRARSDLPVFAQFTIGEDGNTPYGTAPEAAARTLDGWGADIIGLNCSVGPATILEGIETMAEVTDRPLSALPNAGLPRTVHGRQIYLASPEYFARYAKRLVEAGARFIGGCCGTTPEHIAAMRRAIHSPRPEERARGERAARTSAVTVEGEREPPSAREVPLTERSGLGAKLADPSRFLTLVELAPPRGWEVAPMVEAARAARESGADAVTIAAPHRRQARMSPLPAALVVEREAGIEALPWYTCRDRTMLQMMSDLLGAAAAGLRNLVVVSGEPPRQGPYPDATSILDIDSIGLVNLLHRLNEGFDPGGNPIGEPTRFVTGVEANPGAADLEREVRRFMWKVGAGADFAVSQPVFDVAHFEGFLERIAPWPLPMIAGIWPLGSLREAEHLANEVPGVFLPDSTVERMAKAERAGGAEAAALEGEEIAREVVEALRPLVRGIHLVATQEGAPSALEALVGG